MKRAVQLFLGDDGEVRDEVFKLISQLHAQTLMICGEGLENFSNHNDDIRSNYLWSICDLAERSLQLITQLSGYSELIKTD